MLVSTTRPDALTPLADPSYPPSMLADRSYLPLVEDQIQPCWNPPASDPTTSPRALKSVGNAIVKPGISEIGKALIDPPADQTTGVHRLPSPLTPRTCPPSRTATARLTWSPGSVPRSTIPWAALQRNARGVPPALSDHPTTVLDPLMPAA